MQTVELYKPEGQSLGFKVVNNPEKHLEGIFIQEIHDNGIAARYVCVCVQPSILHFSFRLPFLIGATLNCAVNLSRPYWLIVALTLAPN